MAAVKTALGVADRIPRAIERQPVEIIGDRDVARRAGDAVEAKERAGGEIGGRDFADRLAGAVGDQHDVGRGGERAEIADAAGKLIRDARFDQLLATRRPRA